MLAGISDPDEPTCTVQASSGVENFLFIYMALQLFL
jgi:hypothetical protein